MSKNKILTTAILGLLLVTACNKEKKFDKTSLVTDEDKFSYAIGNDIGKGFKKQDIKINFDAVREGIKNVTNGEEVLMTDEEVKKIFEANQKKMMEKQMNAAKGASEKNKKDGKDFLEKKKKEAGVKETKSGLLYKVIKEGTGKEAKLENKVTVNYRGTLIDGKEFDSSYKRKQPATFPLNGVIKGWQEGVQLMKEGSKFEFYVPSDLAYGSKGAGADIGPDSTLIFEVELLKVEDMAAASTESKASSKKEAEHK